MILQASINRPADTTAYASGDVMAASGVTAPIRFSVGTNVLNPQLCAVSITSSNQTGTFAAALHLFNATVTTAADNAAFNPTDAELAARYLGSVTLGAAWNAFAANKVSNTILNQPLSLSTSLHGATVYGVIVLTGAYTPVSGEVITLNLHLV